QRARARRVGGAAPRQGRRAREAGRRPCADDAQHHAARRRGSPRVAGHRTQQPEATMSDRGRVVVVTGLSGARESTALIAVEGRGYVCVDNLPTSLLKQTVEECERCGIRAIGLGIDVRVGSFLEGAGPALDKLASDGAREVRILFLDASDEALLR